MDRENIAARPGVMNTLSADTSLLPVANQNKPHLSIAMKKSFRFVGLLSVAALLGACVSPYQAQMGALHNAYMNGQVSRTEYDREMTRLQVNDAGYQQQSANTATAVAVGAVALGAAAIIANNNDGYHHRHHRYYRPHYYHHDHGW